MVLNSFRKMEALPNTTSMNSLSWHRRRHTMSTIWAYCHPLREVRESCAPSGWTTCHTTRRHFDVLFSVKLLAPLYPHHHLPYNPISNHSPISTSSSILVMVQDVSSSMFYVILVPMSMDPSILHPTEHFPYRLVYPIPKSKVWSVNQVVIT